MAAKKKAAKSTLSNEQKWGIGIGLTAATVAAAGTYFLYGSKDAAKNRKQVKSWMLKAKAEVLEGLERAQHMTKAEYEDLINTIGSAYSTVNNATKKDINEFKKEMKEQWSTIEKYATDALPKKSVAKKKAKKVAKKAAKKVTTKAKKAAAKKKS